VHAHIAWSQKFRKSEIFLDINYCVVKLKAPWLRAAFSESCRWFYVWIKRKNLWLRVWNAPDQARSQVLRFWGGKYIFRGQGFWFHYMFETNFSGHNKIWGKCSPWLQACVAIKKVLKPLVYKTNYEGSHRLKQWFSKWSISTPRGQLDHPRGR